MIRGLASWAIALAAASLATLASPSRSEESWLTSYADAQKLAAKEKKILLMDFTGSDCCGYCIKLKANVFDTTEFKEWAAKNAVMLELDFPRQKPQSVELKKQNLDLKAKHKVGGFPTILFLDDKGQVLGKIVGYQGDTPADWIKKANKTTGRKV